MRTFLPLLGLVGALFLWPAQAGTVADDFERPALSPWQVYNGGFSIVSGDLAATTGGLGIVARTDTFANDQYSELVSAGSTTYMGVFVRRRASDGQRYTLLYSAPNWQIRRDGLPGAPILGQVASSAPVGGDVIRIEVTGTAITGLVNGVVVLAVTDSLLAGGVPGVAYGLPSGSTLPMPLAHSWAGGDL